MNLPLCENCKRPATLVRPTAHGDAFTCDRCIPGDWDPADGLRHVGDEDTASVARVAPALPEWSTVKEVAKRHGYAPKTITAAIRAGRLRAAQDGPRRPYRVHRDDEAEWAEERRTPKTRAPRKQRAKSKRPTGSTFTDLARGKS